MTIIITETKFTFEDLTASEQLALDRFERVAELIVFSHWWTEVQTETAPTFEIIYNNRGVESFFKYSAGGVDHEICLNTADNFADASFNKEVYRRTQPSGAADMLSALAELLAL